MMIISFAQTVAALLAGEKTVTRRKWTDGHARKFHRNDFVQAWDASPRVHGKQVATIRLTVKPYRERGQNIPSVDWWLEGLAYMAEHGYHTEATAIWDSWHRNNPVLWVVRFTLEEVDYA